MNRKEPRLWKTRYLVLITSVIGIVCFIAGVGLATRYTGTLYQFDILMGTVIEIGPSADGEIFDPKAEYHFIIRQDMDGKSEEIKCAYDLGFCSKAFMDTIQIGDRVQVQVLYDQNEFIQKNFQNLICQAVGVRVVE